jgi:hypothetical protein
MKGKGFNIFILLAVERKRQDDQGGKSDAVCL